MSTGPCSLEDVSYKFENFHAHLCCASWLKAAPNLVRKPHVDLQSLPAVRYSSILVVKWIINFQIWNGG